MTRTSAGGALALGLLLGAAACGKPADPGPAASAAPSASAARLAATSVEAGASGDDPAITASVRAVIEACSAGWRPGFGFEPACSAFQSFSSLKVARGSEDATFVHLLDDPSEKVRSLGARGLATWGAAFATDRALAERVVTAAGKETSEAFAGILGYVAGRVDAASTGLGEPIKGLVLREGALQELQAGVLAAFLPANPGSALAFDLTSDMARRGPTTRARDAAVTALSAVYEKRSDEVCAIWMDALQAPEELPAANAAARLTTGASVLGYSQNGWSTTSALFVGENRCARLQGAALTAIEARARAARLVEEGWVTALEGVLRDDLKATPAAEKKRALGVARALVEKKDHSPTLRGKALRLVAAKDPGGPAYAAKFAADPDAYLKTVAAQIAKSK